MNIITAQIILFGEVTDKDGRKKVFCAIQEFVNNEQTKKTSYQFLPFLQNDRLTKNLRVVEAETLESNFVLPCTFPANVDDCVDYITSPSQKTWYSISWDECYFNYSENQMLSVYFQLILQLYHLLVLVLPSRHCHHRHHLHPDLGIVP
jgi:hypothetical protein